MGTRLNLFVIYSDDPASLAAFLTTMGLCFSEHRHGKGPLHFACESEGLVFEIYPASDRNPSTTNRIGLRVLNIDNSLRIATSENAKILQETKESPWGRRAVIEIANQLKIELVESN